MEKNWDREAMRFVSATYIFPQAMLDVAFENGDHFVVAVESVLSPAARDAPVDWANLRVGATGDVLEAPALDTTIEIPWDRIRSVADPDFRAHLARGSAQRARRLGGRIRTMRLEANLTRGELAAKAGVGQEVIANLEAGKLDPPIDVIEHLALAMGKRLRDFAQE